MAYINTATGQYPVSEQDIRSLFPDTSFPAAFQAAEPFAWVFPSPVPAHDSVSQAIREGAPVLTDKGHYEQTWEVRPLDAEAIATNTAMREAHDAKLIATKIDALWRAADAYTSSFISGVAIGILTIGVMQAKPKALSVSTWSSTVWDAYYERKALVTATSQDDLDFSTAGPMPYSVPELRAELGL